MAKPKVMIVEDEDSILELISFHLKREGYTVSTALSGEEALKLVHKEKPDLVLLDLMLPAIDGLEVCRTFKGNSATSAIPIIMVTAKSEEADVVTGLELGADDYITKPFRPRELIARVKTVLRRRASPLADDKQPLKVLNMEIDPLRRSVQLSGTPLDLTYTEFEILHFLALRPGWVFTRYQIVDAVRGSDYAVTDRAVDVQIAGLRKKLGTAAGYIETVRGVGYRFQDANA